MKAMKVFVSVAVLGMGGLVGCGGGEVAEGAAGDEVQSIGQGVCDGPPPSTCAGLRKVPEGLSCQQATFNFTYVCPANASGSSCKLYRCYGTSGTGTWETKTISYTCDDTILSFCS